MFNWLKKDVAKDVALAKQIGAGLFSHRGMGSTGRNVGAAAVGVAGLFATAALDLVFSVDRAKPDRSQWADDDVPFYEQGGNNHEHWRQWD